jgi:beta-lactamase regulating signal transducer with metallopeptidase domain
MSIINKSLVIIIALAVGFLVLSAIMMPFFSKNYRYTCSAYVWKPANAGVTTNCTNKVETANESAITISVANTQYGYTNPAQSFVADNYCLDCTTAGAQTNISAMILIVFALGLIGLALKFLPRFSA